MATFAPRVEYPTEVGKGTRLVAQVGETVTGGGETVTSCVAVGPARDTEVVNVFVTTLVLTAVDVVVMVGVNLI